MTGSNVLPHLVLGEGLGRLVAKSIRFRFGSRHASKEIVRGAGVPTRVSVNVMPVRAALRIWCPFVLFRRRAATSSGPDERRSRTSLRDVTTLYQGFLAAVPLAASC